MGHVDVGREKDGKKPFNSNVVINTDEPWIGEIVEVMEKTVLGIKSTKSETLLKLYGHLRQP